MWSTGAISPSRSIGPFTNLSALALATDAAGNLYVGLTDNPLTNSPAMHVRVYAPDAAGGKPAPLRILQNPLAPGSGQKITGLAISR